MSWYIKVLKNYAVFSGRSRRKEMWMYALFNIIFYLLLLVLIDTILYVLFDTNDAREEFLFIFPRIYYLAFFIPSLAVIVRRLHDTGHSGWVFLLVLTIIGVIPVLIFLLSDSEPGENKYGPNPKNSEESAMVSA